MFLNQYISFADVAVLDLYKLNTVRGLDYMF